MPGGGTPGQMVRRRHRQLGRGVRDAQSARRVRQCANVHGLDRHQHTDRRAVIDDGRHRHG